MSSFSRNLVRVILVLVSLTILTIFGLVIYLKLTSRPIGSPPPGFEDRIKYDWHGISADVKVDIWFGKHGKTYDTTHFRIPNDYLGNSPQYHGEYLNINIAWPSFRSIDKEIKFREKNGLPLLQKEDAIFLSIGEGASTDSFSILNHIDCSPVVRNEVRGVQSCNEKFTGSTKTRHTHYWPIDGHIRTPYHHLPFHLFCQITSQDDGKRPIEICSGDFAYNADVRISTGFLPEKLAIELIPNFPKLLQFIQSLEVKP